MTCQLIKLYGLYNLPNMVLQCDDSFIEKGGIQYGVMSPLARKSMMKKILIKKTVLRVHASKMLPRRRVALSERTYRIDAQQQWEADGECSR